MPAAPTTFIDVVQAAMLRAIVVSVATLLSMERPLLAIAGVHRATLLNQEILNATTNAPLRSALRLHQGGSNDVVSKLLAYANHEADESDSSSSDGDDCTDSDSESD
ncbi:Aste57867_21732 [Aphanomyces stellatus]|uniref:Aste57867_21732 protein n=1 Tax=Aphanomyces stellatus TaxID=120398 RepID=A0A485LJ02_9STRA|nr:hypothetical protein As57867_021663 [Aphanomyces stellatus]VFT98401.1 Aste57867_21732 [Aphanomyces stellatus]